MDALEKKRRIDLIVSQYNGIHPPFEAFYIESIRYAANSSRDAFDRFSQHVVRDAEPQIIVSSVQDALTHAAGLSRFFWPARDKNQLAMARAKKLREAFQMDGSILQNRELRNALEHFDERLDEFLLKDPCGVMLPSALVEPHSLNSGQEGHIFRLVDPFEFVFVILGEEYNFFPVYSEVLRIIDLTDLFSVNGSHLPRN